MRALLRQWLARLKEPDRPDEFEVKGLLSRLGLRVPRGMRLAPGTPADVPEFPEPYAVKVCTPSVIHKTDLNGVHLNVTSADLADTLHHLQATFPEAHLLVEEMVSFEGPEMIVGGLVDPAFGAAVMVGAGGILTEIFQDVTFRLAPLEEDEAGRMLAELKIHPVFEGYRGLRADPVLLARLISAVSQMVDLLGPRFDQLDLNPVVWHSGDWIVLDAKLMLHQTL
jgi:acetyl-CoA synthetase (ADP-forming)